MSWIRKQMLMLVAVAAAISSARGRGDEIIDTHVPLPGTISSFGIPNTQTYGQTLMVPNDGNSVLQSFTFYLNASPFLAFRGEVYAWDGAKATGPALYESDPVSTSGSAFAEPATFSTGGLYLTPGAEYVIFASSSKDNSGHTGTGSFQIAGDVYGGGNFVSLNNSDDPSKWTTTAWSQSFTPQDLVFKADFSAAPLPSTVVAGLGLLGLTGVVLVGRRRLTAV
jgi:hypothetical protein